MIETIITNKELNFINDIDLRGKLLERLFEIDSLFLVNAKYSMVFGCIGTIEGIFVNIANIYRQEIQNSPTYPKTPKGNKKQFKDLTLDELYLELVNLGVLPKIDEYKQFYHLFKDYRNFIHPQAQVKKGWSVSIGQAQMALGLLNATIHNLDKNIFIGKAIFKKVAGNPDYNSQNELHLNLSLTPHNSFAVLRAPISKRLLITFDLTLYEHSVFNFVFNYKDDGDFKMIRLDNRPIEMYWNALLRSSQKYSWNVKFIAQQKKPPKRETFPVRIEIDFNKGLFDFKVDNLSYTFEDIAGHNQNLFNELIADKRIGFFSEVEKVKLSNISIEIG